MKHFIFILLFISFYFEIANAVEDCNPCEPLAEVSLTNKGLSKIIETTLVRNFAELEGTVEGRVRFRDLYIDKSHCKGGTVGSMLGEMKDNGDRTTEMGVRAAQRSAYRRGIPHQGSPESGILIPEADVPIADDPDLTPAEKAELARIEKICYGAPDLDSDRGISSKTPMRPYRAGLTDLKLNELDLKLATPLTCENLRCKATVIVKKIDVTGNFKADFTDKPESLFPTTQIRVTNNPDAEMSVEVEAFINPTTGKIDNLVFLDSDKTKIKINPGSLRFDADLAKPYASRESEATLKAKHYREQVEILKAKLTSPAYMKEQMDKLLLEMSAMRVRENGETSEQATKAIEEIIKEKYGSRAKMEQAIRNIKWPDPSDDKAVLAFLEDPPLELGLAPDVLHAAQSAIMRADAENAGFTNPQVYNFAQAGLVLGNTLLGNQFITDELIKPLLQREMAPLIEQEVNKELRNISSYWQNLSKIPSLNLQNLAALNTLKEKYAKATTDAEKLRLGKEIDRLEHVMRHDWLPIETGIIFDQNTREQKILRAQITNTKPECSNYPRKFSDDKDDDYDMRTELGIPALKKYFDTMAENKKLDVCIDSDNPETCEGGTKITMNKPPQVSCQDGKMVMDLDTEAKKQIFGITADPDVLGQIKAEVDNCGGKVCIKFIDAKGTFRRTILKGFDGMLNQAIAPILEQNNKTPLPIPFVSLKKHQTNPSNCSTKFDWEIKGDK